ncbi:hypothetical protein [Paludisphaera mucosa]|uniref:Uncharacterized protein n=1 Tax=Paludisphaera mucosa TaxID=3030827 RepID=A0ABT6FGF1_9BACT|nr:hypothetical protein [Paludisphaera mucosa]MDG3006661.1 hypothetical protein [Paludisphaera mucosa]
MPVPERLTLLIDGRTVGVVIVEEQSPGGLRGRFEPADGSEPFRPAFDAAAELSGRLDALPEDEPFDYQLYDEYVAACDRIARLRPSFAESTEPIGQFAVEADGSVEVAFGEALHPDWTPFDDP